MHIKEIYLNCKEEISNLYDLHIALLDILNLHKRKCSAVKFMLNLRIYEWRANISRLNLENQQMTFIITSYSRFFSKYSHFPYVLALEICMRYFLFIRQISNLFVFALFKFLVFIIRTFLNSLEWKFSYFTCVNVVLCRYLCC